VENGERTRAGSDQPAMVVVIPFEAEAEAREAA
jgi:hypothetical protein